jgi:hypothetical protein
MLAQTWTSARIKDLYSKALALIEAYVASAAVNEKGAQGLLAFLSQELPLAFEDVQKLGEAMQLSGICRAKQADIHLLARAVARLSALAGFFEPLTGGKSARRLSSLIEVLDDFTVLLEREYQSRHAKELVAEIVSHLGRMKQSKTQTAQIFAAGALTGFLEAQKREKLEKAFKKAVSAFAEVKPFWTKIE